jgi:hypothetical protein
MAKVICLWDITPLQNQSGSDRKQNQRFLNKRYGIEVDLLHASILALLIMIALLTYIYSIKVRVENIGLKEIAKNFYEINQIYRKRTKEIHSAEKEDLEIGLLVSEEMETLKAVCQRISRIFERVIGRKCTVTIKLVTVEDSRCFAHTYVRSEDLSPRDFQGRAKYVVGTGENTAYDHALALRTDGMPSHFYSGNLKKEKSYKNQREHYNIYYRSVLVVPIWDVVLPGEQKQLTEDLIGFLCVDTLSVNRINNRHHLYMLSALSIQMYTFMSFVRGRYLEFNEG